MAPALRLSYCADFQYIVVVYTFLFFNKIYSGILMSDFMADGAVHCKKILDIEITQIFKVYGVVCAISWKNCNLYSEFFLHALFKFIAVTNRENSFLARVWNERTFRIFCRIESAHLTVICTVSLNNIVEKKPILHFFLFLR